MEGVNEKDGIRKFSSDFFKNLKCDVSFRNDILTVKNVPKEFEDFFGKASPYYLVFDPLNVKNADYELMVRGSLLLKTMSSFLSERAQMTLLTLPFTIDPEKEIKKRFYFKNYEIESVVKDHDFDYIFRFTFLTNFQYWNEKEQLTNTIYIHENGVIDNFKVDDFKTIDGKKEDLTISDFKEPYRVSKEYLKGLLEPKKNEILVQLNQALDEGISRIKSQYLERIYEVSDETGKSVDRIKVLQSDLDEASPDEIKKLNDKIKRLNGNVTKLDKSVSKEELEKERDFYIEDEKHKHSLNISNNLMNSTIIYYPIYRLKLYLRLNKRKFRAVEMFFNPLTNNISKVLCEGCKTELREIKFCHESHLSCLECMKRCNICGTDYCSHCEKLECKICKRKICKKCSTKCHKCLKHICPSDISKDYMTGKHLCSNCSSYCVVCGKYTDSSLFTKCSSCGSPVCPKCGRKQYTPSGYRVTCENCLRR